MRIILVRAINVGGARLPMALLRQLAEELGATDVTTFIASGNLLCTPPADANAVETFDSDLEAAIQRECGFYREVISRDVHEAQQALDEHPFEVINPKFSYISFMNGIPSPENIERARGFDTGDDCWDIIGSNLHIRYAHGAGQAHMPVGSLGRALGVPTTARNLNTVRKLIELAS